MRGIQAALGIRDRLVLVVAHRLHERYPTGIGGARIRDRPETAEVRIERDIGAAHVAVHADDAEVHEHERAGAPEVVDRYPQVLRGDSRDEVVDSCDPRSRSSRRGTGWRARRWPTRGPRVLRLGPRPSAAPGQRRRGHGQYQSQAYPGPNPASVRRGAFYRNRTASSIVICPLSHVLTPRRKHVRAHGRTSAATKAPEPQCSRARAAPGSHTY